MPRKKATAAIASDTPPTEPLTLSTISELPEPIREFTAAVGRGEQPDATLDGLLPGTEWASVRKQLADTGIAQYGNDKGEQQYLFADVDDNSRVTAVAAAIPRNAAKSYDFANTISDFQDALTADNASGRANVLTLYNKIYRADGTTNNAVSKLSAMVAPEGSFKVRSVKGQRGKSGDKQAQTLENLCNWWKDNVNARGMDQVITGDRGITPFVIRGGRLCLIEGDHIARHFWPKKQVVVPNIGNYFLPMNLQSFSAQQIVIPDGLQGTNFEIMYWAPPKKFIQQLTKADDANVGKMLQKLIPSDVKSALIKDGQVLLDPALMIHIKNKGTGTDSFGESIIEPTLADIRFKRALDALMLTIITNVIARMVIVKIGSDNEKSVYHSQAVSTSRLGLLQRMMQKVGPAATILWGGPDIEVIQVSAHEALPQVEALYKIAERRHLMSLGLPAVVMIGEGSDGNAAAFAAAMAVVAMLSELQYQYAQALRSIAEAIADENGFEQVDVVWEWHNNKLQDKQAAAELVIKLWQFALLDSTTALEELGYDPAAIQTRMGDDVTLGVRPGVFQPVAGLTQQSQTGASPNPNGSGGETGGAPTNKQNATADPRTGSERTGTAPPQQG